MPLFPTKEKALAQALRGELRHDGSGLKGSGFFGPLAAPDGRTSTEVSIGTDLGEIPALVPTLTRREIEQVLAGNITDEIAAKADSYAGERQRRGMSPFAGPNELRATPGMLPGPSE